MKRLLTLSAACLPCMSLACAQTSDTRRAAVLIVLGVLSVALLIAFGRPAKSKPAEAPSEPEKTEAPEEPKNDPERS